jgi:hypothetical protein
VLYLLVVPDRPHAPTVNIDNTTARTLDDSLPGQLVNPRSRPVSGTLRRTSLEEVRHLPPVSRARRPPLIPVVCAVHGEGVLVP